MKFIAAALVASMFIMISSGAPTFKQLSIDTSFEGNHNNQPVEHFQCARDVFENVLENNDLEGVWAEVREELNKHIENLIVCEDKSTDQDIWLCYTTETEAIKQVLNDLFAALGEDQQDVFAEIYKEIAEQCPRLQRLQRPQLENEFSFLESFNESQPDRVPIVRKLRCIINVIDGVAEENDLGESWNVTRAALLERMDNLNNCENLGNSSATRRCYRNETRAALNILSEYLASLNDDDEISDEIVDEIRSQIFLQCLDNPQPTTSPAPEPEDEQEQELEQFISEAETYENVPHLERLKCVKRAIDTVVERHGLEEEWEPYQTELNATLVRLSNCSSLEDAEEREKCSKTETRNSVRIIQAFWQKLIDIDRIDVIQEIRLEIQNKCATRTQLTFIESLSEIETEQLFSETKSYTNDSSLEHIQCVQAVIETFVERHDLEEEWEPYQNELIETLARLSECSLLEDTNERQNCTKTEANNSLRIIQGFWLILIENDSVDIKEILAEIQNKCYATRSTFVELEIHN